MHVAFISLCIPGNSALLFPEWLMLPSSPASSAMFSGCDWLGGLEGLPQWQLVSQLTLVYCALCKFTEAAGLRTAMSDIRQLQKDALYPKLCSRCALSGWLHHPYKPLTWSCCVHREHARPSAVGEVLWRDCCGTWDNFLVKWYILLSHICPLL